MSLSLWALLYITHKLNVFLWESNVWEQPPTDSISIPTETLEPMWFPLLGVWKTQRWSLVFCYLPQTHLGAAILAPVTHWPDTQVLGESHMSAAGGGSQQAAVLWPCLPQSQPRITQLWGSAGKGASPLPFASCCFILQNFYCVFMQLILSTDIMHCYFKCFYVFLSVLYQWHQWITIIVE